MIDLRFPTHNTSLTNNIHLHASVCNAVDLKEPLHLYKHTRVKPVIRTSVYHSRSLGA